ncbi:MAG TPA: hypothetical protein VHD61_15625 [Lacunisphaera sp.]|nr:hypothetical protein [Lacunisphaera sp.]
MSDQSKRANKFVREKLGAKADQLVPPPPLRVIGTDGGGEDEKDSAPWIELPGGGRQLSAFAKDVGACLADAPVFMRESVAVKINQRTAELELITPDKFRSLVEDYAVTYKSRFYKSGKETIEEKDPATMTRECATGTLAADKFVDQLRRISRVNQVRMPVLRDDGKIELLPEGYDEASETFTLKGPVKISEEMTPEQGAQLLRDYLAEFPFVDERSKAVAVAEMVALYVYGLQELTANRMGFIYKSNKVRSGKSLVAVFGIAGPYGLAEGQTISNQEEMKKLLDATALNGSPYLFFDNLTGNIKSNLLESFMTTPVWTGRVMGTQKTFHAPKGTIVIITGNNITTSADITGRCLLCVLHTEEADPQARKLKRIFTPQYLARPHVRSDILSALWALVRGWDKAGRPDGARRIAGFEEWASIVGGITIAAGFEDPLQKPKDDEATNTEEVDARELVKQLANAMPDGKKTHEFTFQDLVDTCYEFKCFDWKMDGKLRPGDEGEKDWFECNKTSMSALGKVFGEDMAGQIYTLDDGRRVRFGKRGKNRHRRYLVEIVSVAAPKA